MNVKLTILLLAVGLLSVGGWAQEKPVSDTLSQPALPGPPLNVRAFDTPADNGHSISLEWELSPDDTPENILAFRGYKILRAETPEGPFSERPNANALPGATSTVDRGVKESESSDYFPRNRDFYYKVVALSTGGEAESAVVGPVQAVGQFFKPSKTPVLVAVVLFTSFILYFIRRARKGIELYVRPLPGIDAVDEAIGRATEMGKPILYVLGLGTAADIATIASFTILGRVAKKVAEYKTSLIVPCYDPIVMTVAQETVKAGYYDAGQPEAYNQDDVFFVTNQQFAYVGAINGIMIRQKPATNFYLGRFYAESLIMAETGASIGAIQISGTDEVTQIPFFVVACDYTLIGEELYAASAYLGREPVLLGTLKGQDYGKGLAIICLLLSVAAAIFGWTWYLNAFQVTG